MRYRMLAWLLVGAAVSASPALAQAPAATSPPPPPALGGNISFGVGITSGNSDTTNLNGSYEVKFDAGTRNVVKSSGLFLYGKTNGTLSSEQYQLVVRDEYTVVAHAFVFGEVRYLHDRFKGISYLLSPTAGVGYKLVDTKNTSLSLSAGAGSVSEKDYGLVTRTNGAVTFEERLAHKLSASTAVGQSISAVWDVRDFGNGLYLAGLNVTAALVGRVQLKVELLDIYKTRPPLPTLKQNDVAFVTSLVYKF